ARAGRDRRGYPAWRCAGGREPVVRGGSRRNPPGASGSERALASPDRGLFLVVYWLVLRPVKKQALAAFRELPGRAAGGLMPQAAGGAGTLGMGEVAGIEEGGKRASQLKRLLAEKVKAEPDAASRLVQGW